jgi:hypothetical protein
MLTLQVAIGILIAEAVLWFAGRLESAIKSCLDVAREQLAVGNAI